MASRVQVYPDYSYRGEDRRHRPLRFQTNDPVVIPRSRGWDGGGPVLAAAAASALLVAAGTYAVFSTVPPLAETPTAPLSREYVPDAALASASALRALSVPTMSAPEAERVEVRESRSEVLIDDSAPGVQESLPQPLSEEPSTAPYPNPTSTPPEEIAPDDENPYR